MLEPLVRSSGLRFDAVLSVNELKVYKPAPQVYELAARRLAVLKGRVGYWINRTGAPVDVLGFAPDKHDHRRNLGD